MLVAAVSFLLMEIPAGMAAQDPSVPLTFGRDIAPIIFGNCSSCHRPGESAPFPLLSYSDVKKRARQIATVTANRYMPPWLPKAGHGEFAGERRLSHAEIAKIRQWVSQGALEGDLDLTKLPQFPQGWQLGQPDMVVSMPEAYTLPAQGLDVFRNFVIPLPLSETRHIEAVELRPGNPAIVHHAVMQIDRSGTTRQLDAQHPQPGFPGMEMGDSEAPEGHILSWTPGKQPSRSAYGLAWKLAKGSDLVLQLHMVPSGKPEPVQARIGFYFAPAPPLRQSQVLVLRENDIDIPAGIKDYRVRDEFLLPTDVQALSIYPHAHYLGKDIQVYARLADGSKKWLLWIPDWDFNWQDQYSFKQPVLLPRGSTVVMQYSFDNSSENPRNPHIPPRRVVHGGRSSDEMATLALQVLPVQPEGRTLLRQAALQHIIQDPANPNAGAAHHNLARLLESQGKLEKAVLHYRQCLKLNPDDFRAHNNLGVALKALGRLDESSRHFRQALRLRPRNPETLNNLGALRGAQGDLGAAADYFRQALEIEPDNAELHNNLGNALAGQLDEAILHYRQAVRLRPDYAEAHNNLGIALATQGKYEEALSAFRKALQIRPGFSDAQRNLQAVSHAIGKKP